jgi:hypothetical protein
MFGRDLFRINYLSELPARMLLALVCVLLASCKDGVKSGSVSKDFTGVRDVEALSPYSIKVNWINNAAYMRYKVYSDFQSDPLVEQVFEGATIGSLIPEKSYSFKVIGESAAGGTQGGDKEIAATTWPVFKGISEIAVDPDGNPIVKWNYSYNAEFQIFYTRDVAPSASNTGNWTTNYVSSSAQNYTFKGLLGATKYYFSVHALYADKVVERTTAVLSHQTPASFPSPAYVLNPISIGALPFVKVTPVINSLFRSEHYSSVLKRDGSLVSDPLIGAGTLIMSGVSLDPGPVENLSLEVHYSDGTIDETFKATGLSTYVKGQSVKIDSPPISSVGGGMAKLGNAMASGDFNCDGYADLAVGMSQASLAGYGVSVSTAGAVVVYYSYRKPDTTYELKTSIPPVLEPVNPGKDSQIITFDDLGANSQFGFSLASGGNLNGDKLGLYSCEDLIVGAPYEYYSGYRVGRSYVFFGGRNGLARSAHLSDMPENVETCDGLAEDATCSPVRLWPDHSLWPSSVLGGAFVNTYPYSSGDLFGYSVAFLGDINGDGYDDIGIGAPYGDWDGKADLAAPAGQGYVSDVGYVAIYFGSRFGIGYETPTATGIPSGSDARFRWLKIFPPIVEQNMRFGSSIAGGGDVDGYYRVRNANGKSYGGSDFVVGAPGFSYANPQVGLFPFNGNQGISPAGGGWTRTAGSYANATNAWGMNQGTTSTGISFLYFGRGMSSLPTGGDVDKPYRNNYWSCQERGMISKRDHYSCLTSSSSFRVLFPRIANSTGFGSAVLIAGNKSRYDENNTILTSFKDPNRDGFSEVLVSAPYGDSANTDVGHLWQFFGNGGRLFEGIDFKGVAVGGDSGPDGDFRINDPACVDFTNHALISNQAACAPTVLRSDSIATSTQMGSSGGALVASDISGDGLLDIVVGAPNDSTKGAGSGAVYVYRSAPNIGVTSVFSKLYSEQGDSDDRLGTSVASGNFNGDFGASVSLMDIAVGAPGDEAHRPGAGTIHLFNTENGTTLPAIRSESDVKLSDDLATLSDYLYYRTQIVGDLNGDGYDDAVGRMIKISSAGVRIMDAIVYYGSKVGLVTTELCRSNPSKIFLAGSENLSSCYPAVNQSISSTKTGIRLPQLILKPNNVSDLWVSHALPAGDVNGDSFDDVAFIDTSSSLIIYYGTGGGLQAVSNPSWVPDVNDPQIVTQSFMPGVSENTVGCNSIGCSGSGINTSIENELLVHGDLNGDGFEDVVIANPRASSPPMNTATSPKLPPVELNVLGIGAGAGWHCNPAPASNDTRCSTGAAVPNHGIVYVLYGSANGLQTPSVRGLASPGTDFSLTNATYAVSGYDSESNVAQRACSPGTAKSCKGQFLRNPIFENVNYGYAELGHLFGSGIVIMDHNNDGFDDLLVGAMGFEDLTCLQGSTLRDYGRIYVFGGSDEGLVAGPESSYYMSYSSLASCPSTLTNPAVDDKALGTQLLGNQKLRALMPQIAYEVSNPSNGTRRLFGSFMSVAGDINKDGYEDLVVTTPNEGSLSYGAPGMAYVYYGPLCGADNEIGMLSLTQNESNFNRQFLWSNPTDAGQISSINFASDCQTPGGPKLPMQKFLVLGSTSGDMNGTNVVGGRKGLGDVNKDGYDDVLIGGRNWDDLTRDYNDIGRGIIYFGSSRGLFTSEYPDLNSVADSLGRYKPFMIVPKFDLPGAIFFSKKSSLGDVNGDSSADYMIVTPGYDGEAALKGVDLGGFFLFY